MRRTVPILLSSALVGALACGGRVTHDGDLNDDADGVAAPSGGLGGARAATGGLASGGASRGPSRPGGSPGAGASSGGSPITGGTSPSGGAGGAAFGGAFGGAPLGTGGAATGGLGLAGEEPLGTGGEDPEPRDCGPLIDDMEDATGRVCDDGVRRGVWYTFNDEGAEQWPAPQTPGVPIPVEEIPGGRGESLNAMRTYGGSFAVWGAGLGVDLAFDSVTYAQYDASAYDGITFWVRGDRGHAFEVRMSDEATTLVDFGGTCENEPCVENTREVAYDAEWTEVWVPFDGLSNYGRPLDPSRLTNLQFFVRDNPPCDFWIDDLSFFSGAPACGAGLPPECQDTLPIVDPSLAAALGQPSAIDTCDVTVLVLEPPAGLEPIASLDGLHCYGALASLSAAGQALSEVDELTRMPQLSAVVLADNALTSLDGLESAGYLDLLDVSGNQLVSLGALGAVTGMTVLRAAGNLLTDAAGLEAQGALVEFDLADNQLTSITALPPLPALTRLSLAGNSIEDVGVLAAATSLVDVDLSDNLVTDITALHDYYTNWGSFHPAIHVEENPQLDCAAEAENLAALRARGVDVFVDCPVE